MGLVFKDLNKDNIKVTPYTAHKQWNVTLANATDLGVITYDGEYAIGDFNISDHPIESATTYATTSNGQYKRLIHASIDKLYYAGNDNRYDVYCNENPNKQIREYSSKVTVISIPRQIFGDKLHAKSFKLTSGSVVILDDGFGNLYDSTDTNDYISNEHTTLHLGLWEGYRFNQTSVTTTLKTEGQLQLSSAAQNIQFVDGKWGKAAKFHGTISSQESTNSVIRIDGSADISFDDDFAISFWFKAPTAQSSTRSYIGRPTPSGERALSNVYVNSMLSKAGFTGNHIPFDISIANDRSNADGKIIFKRESKSGSGLMQIFSAATYNDSTLHHCLVQKNGSTIELYIDNGTPVTATDTAIGVTTSNDIPIHVGGRRCGFKHYSIDDGWTGENIAYPFTGEIDEVKFFDRSLTSAERTSNYSSVNNTNRVGNIMYEHGIATITTPLVGGKDIYHSSSAYDELSFKGSHNVTEHMYVCNVLDGEYNSSYNITLRDKYDINSEDLRSHVTQSEFSPYITSVGLYNDSGDLCAIGKMAQPIKKPDDYDISFMIRFDTN